MSLLRLVLKAAAPLPKLEGFSRYLFIGPHPDDIEIGAGATVSKLVSLGKGVSFLICLDGRYGLTNAPEGTTPKDLIEIRKKEALESAAMLGVDDVHFLETQGQCRRFILRMQTPAFQGARSILFFPTLNITCSITAFHSLIRR